MKIKYYTQSRRRTTFTYKKKSKANCIGHGLLKHVIDRRKKVGTEMVKRHGRKCKQLLDDQKEMSRH